MNAHVLTDKFGIGRTQGTNLIKNKEPVLKLCKSYGNDQMKTYDRHSTIFNFNMQQPFLNFKLSLK